MVADEREEARVSTNEVHHAGRVWASVDEVSQQNHAIFRTQVKSVQEGAQGGQMPVHVSNGKDAVPGIKAGLQVRLKPKVPPRGGRRKLCFARQGVSPGVSLARLHPPC